MKKAEARKAKMDGQAQAKIKEEQGYAEAKIKREQGLAESETVTPRKILFCKGTSKPIK